MKIALINGSPKVKDSASKTLLEELHAHLSPKAECIELEFHTATLSPDEQMLLLQADAWIFAFPLYVDGIPAHLLSCLVGLEQFLATKGKQNTIGNDQNVTKSRQNTIRVYGIANCGFYEGIQAEYALEILQNWSRRAGLTWGGGIGVGGGGGLSQMPKTAGHGPWAPIIRTFTALSETILQAGTTDNQYISVAFPRFLYKIAAQSGWRQSIRRNGGKARDLGNKPK